MRFGLIANLRRTGAVDAVRSIVDWSEQQGHDLVLSDGLRKAFEEFPRFAAPEDLARQVDILVSMGGDGTLLASARAVGEAGTPILGINLGSLGFLTQQTPKELVKALDAIVAGDYVLENRMLLQVDVDADGKQLAPKALNDVVVDNGPVARVLRINLTVNGEEVVTYLADGLIISTPTGSTAYSLAVGGPIVRPDMDAIIAAAIAPFSLSMRPMIFCGGDVLELKVLSEGRPANLTIDGQVGYDLNDGQVIRITRANYYARTVSFPENSYYQLLRNKLRWGLPPKY